MLTNGTKDHMVPLAFILPLVYQYAVHRFEATNGTIVEQCYQRLPMAKSISVPMEESISVPMEEL